MITKYDMASGERIYQTRNSKVEAMASTPYGPTAPTPALQLIEVESQPEPEIMPADLALISIPTFLKQQR